MIRSEPREPGDGCEVGICATGASYGVVRIVQEVLAVGGTPEVPLRNVTVVASDCPVGVLDRLEKIADRDARLRLVVEAQRHGKAAAINQILRRFRSEFLVLVNADSHPESGALAELLRAISSDESAGVVSARPVPLARPGLASKVAGLMWTAHNECSLALNHMGLANHSSDEMVALRRASLETLPEGLVNDGAFLAVRARQRGYGVKFSSRAQVGVETPVRLADAIGQRRRILFGHAEVWRRTGTMPKTMESLLIVSPAVGVRLLVATLARNPGLLLVLPVAAVCEVWAALLSVWDTIMSSGRHTVWRRYT